MNFATRTRLFASIFMLAAPLLFSDAAFAKKDKDADGDGEVAAQVAGNNGKIDICHRTGSAKNPGVLINVSINAASAHYGHGDPLTFEELPGNKCQEVTPVDPTVDLTLSASSVVQHSGTAVATWTSTDALACTLNVDGSITAVGTSSAGTVVGPFATTGTKTVSITCTGNAGSTPATDSAQLSVNAPPAPTVNLSLGASSLLQNTGSTTATWTSANTTSCTLTIDGGTPIANATSGVAVGPFSTTGTKTVSISCAGALGTTPATDSETLTVTAPPPPTVDLTLAANSIAQNTGTTTANWTSANTTSCTLTIDGGTPIANAVSGTTVGPFSTAGTKTVSISCAGAAGTTPATDSETLTVTAPPPAPTLTLSVASSTVPAVTGFTTATWSSTNTTACMIGSANVGTSGSQQMGPYPLTDLNAVKTLTVVCTGQDGSTVSQFVTVTVVAAPLPPVQMCVISTLGGGSQLTYIVDYTVETGEFTGQTADGQHIEGSLAPNFTLNASNQLVYATGSAISFEADGLTGNSRAGTSSFGAGAGSTGTAVFTTVDVYNGSTLVATTSMTLKGSCTGLPPI